MKQGKRYDSNDEYVRRWLPELADVGEGIHEPWTLRDDGQATLGTDPIGDYPTPTIDVATVCQRPRDGNSTPAPTRPDGRPRGTPSTVAYAVLAVVLGVAGRSTLDERKGGREEGERGRKRGITPHEAA